MRIEVISPEVGVFRSVHLASAGIGDMVDVVVFLRIGGPVFGTIRVVGKRSGRGLHRALECPSCKSVASVLFTDWKALGCCACIRHLTRRQRERTTRGWMHGGQLEDWVMRAVARAKKSAPSGGLAAAIESLHQHDRLIYERLQADVEGLVATLVKQ